MSLRDNPKVYNIVLFSHYWVWAFYVLTYLLHWMLLWIPNVVMGAYVLFMVYAYFQLKDNPKFYKRHILTWIAWTIAIVAITLLYVAQMFGA